MNVYNDDKNSTVWRELDGDLYNNQKYIYHRSDRLILYYHLLNKIVY